MLLLRSSVKNNRILKRTQYLKKILNQYISKSQRDDIFIAISRQYITKSQRDDIFVDFFVDLVFKPRRGDLLKNNNSPLLNSEPISDNCNF